MSTDKHALIPIRCSLWMLLWGKSTVLMAGLPSFPKTSKTKRCNFLVCVYKHDRLTKLMQHSFCLYDMPYFLK